VSSGVARGSKMRKKSVEGVDGGANAHSTVKIDQ
jgi:hypothetical protein